MRYFFMVVRNDEIVFGVMEGLSKNMFAEDDTLAREGKFPLFNLIFLVNLNSLIVY